MTAPPSSRPPQTTEILLPDQDPVRVIARKDSSVEDESCLTTPLDKVYYSLDGEELHNYRVEVQSEQATRKTKSFMRRFGETLHQQDFLEDFDWIPFVDTSTDQDEQRLFASSLRRVASRRKAPEPSTTDSPMDSPTVIPEVPPSVTRKTMVDFWDLVRCDGTRGAALCSVPEEPQEYTLDRGRSKESIRTQSTSLADDEDDELTSMLTTTTDLSQVALVPVKTTPPTNYCLDSLWEYYLPDREDDLYLTQVAAASSMLSRVSTEESSQMTEATRDSTVSIVHTASGRKLMT